MCKLNLNSQENLGFNIYTLNYLQTYYFASFIKKIDKLNMLNVLLKAGTKWSFPAIKPPLAYILVALEPGGAWKEQLFLGSTELFDSC